MDTSEALRNRMVASIQDGCWPPATKRRGEVHFAGTKVGCGKPDQPKCCAASWQRLYDFERTVIAIS